ncbi:hypothetical protein VF13_39570, partial [Nostoc linckia z16]
MALSSSVTSALAQVKATNPASENNNLLPKHNKQTQYRYNSLNQLVWQQTPDGNITTFAYDDLGRIIASQNSRQQLSYYGMPENLVLSDGLVVDGGIIKKVLNDNPQVLLKGNSPTFIIEKFGFVEYTIHNEQGTLNDEGKNERVRVGLSYVNDPSAAHINYGFVAGTTSASDQNVYLSILKDTGIVLGSVATIPPAVEGDPNLKTYTFRIERKEGGKIIWSKKDESGVSTTLAEESDASSAPLMVDFALQRPNSVIRNLTVGVYNNGDRYSFTRYDGLGRIIEAGEIYPSGESNATSKAFGITADGRLQHLGAATTENALVNDFPADKLRKEVTRTMYDKAPFSDVPAMFTSYSGNTRNRVSGVLYYDTFTTEADLPNYNNAIFYDYDVHGNVRELVHVNNDPDLFELGQKIKKITYDYDLISGNVNRVTYQPGAKDQFIHRYEYDADNRITSVYTSTDNVIWEKDANYQYYQHGPLARVELGDKKVQGLDYIYTLQGWLKGVNGERTGRAFDAGGDGLNVAKDAFGFALNYYNGDYKARGGAALDARIRHYSVTERAEGSKNLYNGNIKEMVTSTLSDAQKPLPTQFNFYTYDQLNRIKGMTSTAYTYDNTFGNIITRNSSLETSYRYDRDGNFLAMTRKFPTAITGAGTASEAYAVNLIDNFTYRYYAGTNKLRHVKDAVTAAYAGDDQNDIKTEENRPYNYKYDEAGQLINDYGEGLKIDWRTDGKVKSVTKADNTLITFGYDGLGTRIFKKEAKPDGTVTTLYYERDAQGNPMATYQMIKAPGQPTVFNLAERSIYGSSRLGTELADMSLMPPTQTTR